MIMTQDLLACTKYDNGFTPESVWSAYCEACELSNSERRTSEVFTGGRPNGIADLITCAAMYLAGDECGGEVNDVFLEHLDGQLIYTWDLGQLAMEGLMDGQFLQGSFYPDPDTYCETLIDVIGQVATYLVPVA